MTNLRPNISHGRDEVSLKELIVAAQRILSKWPILLGCVLIAIAIASVYNYYTPNQYRIEAKVAIEERENPLASFEGVMDLGMASTNNAELETRMAVLESYSHNVRVAERLNWDVIYYNKGRLNKREVYNPSHFRITIDRKHLQVIGVEFNIDFRDQNYFLSYDIDEISADRLTLPSNEKLSLLEHSTLEGEHRYDEWIECDFFRFRVQKGPNLDQFLLNQKYTTSSFKITSKHEVAAWAEKMLEVSKNGKGQNPVLILAMAGPIVPKMVDFLNASILELQDYELQQKNLIAENTIRFIDEQLVEIEDQLSSSQRQLEEFRSENLIVDLNSEASNVLDYFTDLEKEKSAVSLQQDFYEYVLDFLTNNEIYSGLSLPTLNSFNDPLVFQLAERLLLASADYERLKYSLELTNPALISLEQEIEFTKQFLSNVARNALISSKIISEDLDRRLTCCSRKN